MYGSGGLGFGGLVFGLRGKGLSGSGGLGNLWFGLPRDSTTHYSSSKQYSV